MILVTGVAGFIGFHVARRLLDAGEAVVGIDNFDPYYDPSLKAARATELQRHAGFSLVRIDIRDAEAVAALFKRTAPRRVVHLAAQAGVRYSLENPLVYERTNVGGHLSVLDACRSLRGFDHLVYASSSSVYGERSIAKPFREDDPVDAPVSLYAATKRAAELLSISYAHTHAIPQTGLRLFTAYGPWGRPDMAYFRFVRRILSGDPIEVYGKGEMVRDFTYVSDIVDAIQGILERPPVETGHRLLNVGSSHPTTLHTMIEILEAAVGKPAEKIYLPRPPGDVFGTYADISSISTLIGFRPRVSLADGLRRFVIWYRDEYAGSFPDRDRLARTSIPEDSG
jgi:UDP-glucuronate 4-epimerase